MSHTDRAGSCLTGCLIVVASLTCGNGLLSGVFGGESEQVGSRQPVKAERREADKKDSSQANNGQWRSLFDGKSLKNWKPTNFGGEGEVTVEEGNLVIGFGVDLSGVNYTGEIPEQNFEVELEAKRINGSDFFCGLTVPVGKSYGTLIIGGWGGGLCGISSLDGNDASENETATWQSFEDDKWYKIRLRIEPERIQAWLDGERIVNAHTKGRKITLRGEVLPSRPFGISTYQTTGALRNIRIRKLTEADAEVKTK